jgi:hypothetical protein
MFVGRQKLFVGSQSPFATAHSVFAAIHLPFGSSRSPFAASHRTFAKLHLPFRGVQTANAALQTAFVGRYSGSFPSNCWGNGVGPLIYNRHKECLMPRFPRTEPEIAALAHVMAQGLGQASEDFPTPPVAADELQAQLDSFNAATIATVAAETARREQHAVKDDALEELANTPRWPCATSRIGASTAGSRDQSLGKEDRTEPE